MKTPGLFNALVSDTQFAACLFPVIKPMDVSCFLTAKKAALVQEMCLQ